MRVHKCSPRGCNSELDPADTLTAAPHSFALKMTSERVGWNRQWVMTLLLSWSWSWFIGLIGCLDWSLTQLKLPERTCPLPREDAFPLMDSGLCACLMGV